MYTGLYVFLFIDMQIWRLLRQRDLKGFLKDGPAFKGNELYCVFTDEGVL